MEASICLVVKESSLRMNQHTEEGRAEPLPGLCRSPDQAASEFHAISGLFNDACNIIFKFPVEFELGSPFLAIQHTILGVLPEEAASSTRAPLLSSPRLDHPKEAHFQMGNKTCAKRKSKDWFKELVSEFYPMVLAQFVGPQIVGHVDWPA